MTISATETWQHHEVMTNGIRMHYVTQGTGPLVILLHGFPEFWYSWRFQILFLAEHGYTIVAPDLRGYNETDKPTTGYDVITLTNDIAGLIKGIGAEKAIIVGHDWGGTLAWIFAGRFPQMTEKLIVMNAPHPQAMEREMHTFQQIRKSWYMFFFQIPRLPEYILLRNHAQAVSDMVLQSAVQKAAFTPDDLNKFRDAMCKPGAITASLNYYRQLSRFRTLSRGRSKIPTIRPKIVAPTLLIWGEQDVALGMGLTKGLDEWVEHIQVRYIPDSGHWVQQEKHEVVNEWMLEFLQ